LFSGQPNEMLDQAFLVLGWIDLPDLLEADAELRRLAIGVARPNLAINCLVMAAARAFGEQGVLPSNSMPRV